MDPPKPSGKAAPAEKHVRLLPILGGCSLTVFPLFAAYEFAERRWLADAAPEALHTLHVLRGLSAAAVSAVTCMLLLLRQIHTGEADPLPPTASWTKRLQRIRLRTKITVPMTVLAVGPVLMVGIFMVIETRRTLRESITRRVAFDTRTQAKKVEAFLQEARRNLGFLRQMGVVRELVGTDAGRSPQRAAALREEVKREFQAFLQGERSYCRAECLDREGRSSVRLEVVDGAPQWTSASPSSSRDMQGLAERAERIRPGTIQASRMTLEAVHGPGMQQGVLSYTTPVLGEDGRTRGLLSLCICEEHLLTQLGPLPPGMEAWLVDAEGVYLGCLGPPEERRARYALARNRHLGDDYPAAQADALLRGGGTREAGETQEALLFSEPVAFDEGGEQRPWVLLVSHPRLSAEAPLRQQTVLLAVVMVLAAAIAMSCGLMVGHYLARPVGILRRATREIARGDLSRRAAVGTGDEIEGLAIDFNVMADRLQQAQQRLSDWNAALEREVALRTEDLRQLQDGLARADRLASIGQMTAGVMHEVGNPLAAIKTRIQVASEGDGPCAREGCRGLRGEILKEVDRLAGFLRSFSRLSRLGKAPLEPLSLAEVARGVHTLIAPELRRRGLGLRVSADGEIPPVLGNRDQLHQMLINLVLNAADASPRGAEILLGMTASGDGAEVRVEDRGEGIPAAILDRIWEPFFTTKPEGSGLGLAICRSIAASHGGGIHAERREGGGTRIRIRLPLAP